ncbi:MAG: hypothetical protein QG630_509 [Patescibacteria group bacterium]|nr:hypothetical protein [Patescibacteria group bacterium]
MINNLQNLFIKYSNNLNPKNKILESFTFFFKKEFNLDLKKEDFKIDIKNKTIYLNKNNSSLKFFFKINLIEEKKELLEKETGFKINF